MISTIWKIGSGKVARNNTQTTRVRRKRAIVVPRSQLQMTTNLPIRNGRREERGNVPARLQNQQRRGRALKLSTSKRSSLLSEKLSVPKGRRRRFTTPRSVESCLQLSSICALGRPYWLWLFTTSFRVDCTGLSGCFRLGRSRGCATQ